jgi:large repetitive protein
MNSRRVLRRLRSKTALLVLAALAVAALTIPGLAGATSDPTITSPGSSSQKATWNQTFTFTADGSGITSYDLLRAPATPASGCDSAALASSASVATESGSDPLSPTPLVDPDSLSDGGDYCYWVQASDASTSNPVEILYDTAAPSLSLDTFPSNPSNVTAPTFTYTAEPGSTVTCTLDGSPQACSSTVATPTTAQGSHTFTVTAKDAALNATTQTYTWTVDTTPPTLTLNSHPGDPSKDTTPSFGYTAGTGTVTCTMDGSPFACSSSAATTTISGDTSHTFAVTNTDAALNSTTRTYTWDLDTVAPSLSLDSHPADPSNDTTPAFSYTAEPGSTVTCTIDGSPLSCTSTSASPSISTQVSHTFVVTATDAALNTSTQTFTWVLDTTAPSLTLDTKPTNPSNSLTPSFAYTAAGGSTVTCTLDGSPLACSSTAVTPTIAGETAHTFTVTATDAALNATTRTWSWTLDTTAPTLTLDTKPTDPSNTLTPAFAYTAGGGSTVSCTLDASPLACGSSSVSPTVVGQGSHTFTVTATDSAQNATTRTYTWSVDTVKPVATIGTKPASVSNVTAPLFTFTSSEPTGATFECSIDSTTAYAPCTTPFTTPTLAPGSHTFYVKAIDLAANHSTSPDSFPWTIDTTPPSGPTSFQLVGAASTPDPPRFKFVAATDAHGPISYRLSRSGQDAGTFSTSCTGFVCMTDSTILADGTDDGDYTYTVAATDAAGNTSTTSGIAVTIDGGAPSVPAGVHTAAPLTGHTPTLSWNASTGQPATYKVYRGGLSIGTVTAPATTFSDATLPLDGTLDGTYTYTVSAVDMAGNESAASLGVQVVLDTTHPLPASTVMISQSPTAAKPLLIWPSSGSGDVAGYNVYRGGAKINGALVATTSFSDAGLDADGTYAYTVRAVDKAGNESGDSISASVLYDTTAPGTPGASAAAAPSGGTATVSWAATSDAGAGVASYQVRRSAANGGPPGSLAEGTPICGSVPASARGCSDAGLTPGASYRYSVFAIDAVGNVSLPGQTATISIPSTTDKTPPKAPTALHALLANGQINLTWKNPKSDLATITVVWNSKRAPRTSRDGNMIYHGDGTKVSLKLPKLQAGKQMRFGVFAVDRVGNVSVAARATVNVPQPSAVSLAPSGKLSGSPGLTWNAVTGATYYNVQVFEGTQAAKRVGIAWPAVTKYTLPGTDMKKGKVYTWYVWPGIGAKSAAKYGKLIGKVTFTYTG